MLGGKITLPNVNIGPGNYCEIISISVAPASLIVTPVNTQITSNAENF